MRFRCAPCCSVLLLSPAVSSALFFPSPPSALRLSRTHAFRADGDSAEGWHRLDAADGLRHSRPKGRAQEAEEERRGPDRCDPHGYGRQLRHCFALVLDQFSRIVQRHITPTRAVRHAPLGAHADRVLIGAWNPML